jgi:hypothetical protein
LNDGFGGFAGGVVISDIFWRDAGWLVSSCSGVRWLEWSEKRIFWVLLFGWGVLECFYGVCTRYMTVFLYLVHTGLFVPGTLLINTLKLTIWHNPIFYF